MLDISGNHLTRRGPTKPTKPFTKDFGKPYTDKNRRTSYSLAQTRLAECLVEPSRRTLQREKNGPDLGGVMFLPHSDRLRR